MKHSKELVIVEDNPMYRELLVQYFKNESGYEIKAFADAESCLQSLKKPPAAYLLDEDLDPMETGGLSGHQLLQTLRKKGLNAPALFLTGHEAVQPVVDILKAGAFSYMRKEVDDLSQVSQRISQMLQWQDVNTQVIDLHKVRQRGRNRTMLLLGILAAAFTTLMFWP